MTRIKTTEERRISYSEFKNWSECPYRHKLIYIDKKPYYSANEYAAFGTAIHSVCEKIFSHKEINLPEAFEEAFLKELLEVKKENQIVNKKLVKEMRSQAPAICQNVLPTMIEHFGDFEVIGIEEPLLEPITEFDSYGKKFKGFIDLVIKTRDGKYHIIDWKTCSWGWSTAKKTDKIINYQLTMYKNYFSKKHDIDPKDIETYFALLKRTAKNNNVEIFRVTSGEKKTSNCLSSLERSVINIEKGVKIKNRLSCKYCKFYQTKDCV